MIPHCYSTSIINVAKDPIDHEQTKHVGVDCHFMGEKIIKEESKLAYKRIRLQIFSQKQ